MSAPVFSLKVVPWGEEAAIERVWGNVCCAIWESLAVAARAVLDSILDMCKTAKASLAP